MKALKVVRRKFLLLALLLASAGCVTEIQKPAAQIKLFTTRVGDEVTLSWQTRPGEQYAIMYSETRGGGGHWTALPGCERIDGTGETLQKNDEVAAGMQRYYRLVVVPAKQP